MHQVKRYNQREFPSYAHRPGETPHPKKAGGHSEGMSDPKSYEITSLNWSTHEDYLYSVDLFNYGFYWESHVWLEAIWKACPKGPKRDFIQSLIKVCAAALKNEMNQPDIAKDHLDRAYELMSSSFRDENILCYFGVSRKWWEYINHTLPITLELHFE